MGCIVSTDKVVIANLNYSGILLSPFEFYSEQSRNGEEKISQCFRKNMKKLLGQKADQKGFKWNLGKIDQKMQKDRYTPIYGKSVGIQSGRLIDEKKFQQLWKEHFNKNISNYDFPFNEEEKQNALKFDLCCYKTLLQIAYDTDIIEFEKVDVARYKKLMDFYFSKDYLNEKKKINKIFEAIKDKSIDIFFLQQVSNQLTDAISLKQEDFYYIRADEGESMIIVKRSKFKKIQNGKDALGQKKSLVNSLNWNKDTAVCFVDRFILISSHLSSKNDKNPQQVQEMLKSLEQLKQIYPQHEILIGIDANTYLEKSKMKDMHLCPKISSISTTMKKRTWVQPQTHKAQILTASSRDFLISTIPLKGNVMTIEGVDSKKVSYLPSTAHPYDHFCILGEVDLLQ